MKSTFIIGLGLLVLLLNACDSADKKLTSLTTQKDSLSYGLGIMIGSDLKKQSMDTLADINVFLQAMREVLTVDGAPILTSEESEKIVTAYLEGVNAAKYDQDKSAGEKYIEENGKRKEVTTLSSGLQYEVIKEGTGPKATTDKVVKVHYTGTFIDGKVFDSSRDGEPATFPLANVIKGWQEGICLMNVGAHYKLYIPWYLAYGDKGIPGAIPPFTSLVFDVELLEIQ
ncbi:MAG: peptidylprolyl isomerase [Bacteroidetes bacterium HGW-Bacteroidetes-21]|jgi:FKBP-type peptidyl-prolyl cis-trans isomerase FklB|nr:MAG: peptidylprolyl isomerase [Bacteroidetes bacterium HGW-Bacteroidetes-21]